MEFILDSHSPLPPHLQIQEQIKLALLLGRLRPGDTLPSIRDVEKQTHVGRNIVRKAYLSLQRSGILTLRHGKGVLVEKHLSYSRRVSIMEQCEALTREILIRTQKSGISSSAFARYLYQQALEHERTMPSLIFVDARKSLASDRAAMISAFWQTNVPGLSLDELAERRKSGLKGIRTILTNYLRLDQVKRIVRKSKVDVIPLSLIYTQEMREEFRRLPSNASVVLVLDDRDYPSLSLILESYRQILVDRSVKLTAIPRSQIRDLNRFVKLTQHNKIIFSNRIWEDIPKAIRKMPWVTHPRMDIDLTSLENIRIQAGVLI